MTSKNLSTQDDNTMSLAYDVQIQFSHRPRIR